MERGAGRLAMTMIVTATSLACASCSLFGGDKPDPGPTTSATVTVTRPVPLTADSARTMESQARSGSVAQVAKTFVLPDAEKVSEDFVSQLAALQQFAIDEKAFRQSTDTSASVPVVTTDGKGLTTRWTATLVLVDGAWRIVSTEKVTP